MASASELRSPSWCACRRSALSPASKPPRSPALLHMTTTVATRSECDTSMGVASACEKASTPQPSPHRSVGTLSSAQCTGACSQPERSISSPLSPARESSLSSSIPSSPAAPRGQRKQPRFNGCYALLVRRKVEGLLAPKPLLPLPTQLRDAAAAPDEPTATAPTSPSTEETMSQQVRARGNDRDQHQLLECLRRNFFRAYVVRRTCRARLGNIAAVETAT